MRKREMDRTRFLEGERIGLLGGVVGAERQRGGCRCGQSCPVCGHQGFHFPCKAEAKARAGSGESAL